MRKTLVVIVFVLSFMTAKSQSMVTEISWTIYNQAYTGLLVIYPDNHGVFKVKTFIGYSWCWITQDAVLTNSYDAFGNCTSYINCYYPRSTCNVPYAADNFIVYPNGTMYTQDAGGNWSTLITAYVVPPIYWQAKFKEYGLS